MVPHSVAALHKAEMAQRGRICRRTWPCRYGPAVSMDVRVTGTPPVFGIPLPCRAEQKTPARPLLLRRRRWLTRLLHLSSEKKKGTIRPVSKVGGFVFLRCFVRHPAVAASHEVECCTVCNAMRTRASERTDKDTKGGGVDSSSVKGKSTVHTARRFTGHTYR